MHIFYLPPEKSAGRSSGLSEQTMEIEFKKISNIAFAKTCTESIFRCLITRCGFESNERRNFEVHLRQHLNDGHIRDDSSICITCSARINAENVIGEFTHMMVYHIESEEVAVKTETVEPQKDISTDDESSENITYTTLVEELQTTTDIKVEKTSDYDINAMFTAYPVEATSEIMSQLVSVAVQTHVAAQESESGEKTITKNEESQSSSSHRRSPSTRDKTSHATSKDKIHSKSESSSSKKGSSSKSSDQKTRDRSRSEKDSKKSEKSHEKSEKLHSESRLRKYSSSSSSKSYVKSSEKLSSHSNRNKTSSNEASPRQKRSALSSPIRETASPEKKMRLEILNHVVDKIEAELSTSLGLLEKRVEENMQIDSGSSFMTSTQSDVLPALAATDLGNKIQTTDKPIELVSEFGTIPFKKIEGRIPKKISVVVTESSPMPVTEIMHYQQIAEDQPTSTQKIENHVKVTASQLMPWIENLKRNNFKFKNHYQLMTSQRKICLLYKCMDADCSFSISKYEKFLEHLEEHTQKESDTKFYLLCPYCRVKKDPLELARHIKKVHSFDRYQCSYCFFRSPEPGTVREHLFIHHNDTGAAVLQCFGNCQRSPEKVDKREKDMFDFNAEIDHCKCKFVSSLKPAFLHE